MGLPRFAVSRMLAAEAAILGQLDAVGGVLLVLLGVIVALLALGAGNHNIGSVTFYCHDKTPLFLKVD
jgi:ABC-type antimicrobial peptide transport system permease subunit